MHYKVLFSSFLDSLVQCSSYCKNLKHSVSKPQSYINICETEYYTGNERRQFTIFYLNGVKAGFLKSNSLKNRLVFVYRYNIYLAHCNLKQKHQELKHKRHLYSISNALKYGVWNKD